MPLDFPDNPAPHERFIGSNGVIYFWNAQFGVWIVLHDDPTVTSLFAAPGTITDFAGASAPTGWYLCDGSLKNRDIDAPLFAAIGELYGEGDGETTFALPDLRGCITAGSAAGIAEDNARLWWMELGDTYGETSHILTLNEMTNHSHGVGDPTHGHGDYGHGHGVGDGTHQHYMTGPPHGMHGGNYFTSMGGSGVGLGYVEYSYGSGTGVWVDWGYASLAASGTGIWYGGAGGDGAHNNVQHTMVLNKIIKR